MEYNHFFELLKKSVSPFQCVAYCKEELLKQGFEEITYDSTWNLKKGGRYIMEHHGSTMFAFTIGEQYQPGDMIRMGAAHTDFPCLRIKPNADFITKGYAQINTEVYGGPIFHTWLDRPLGIAGRVAVCSENLFEPQMRLYDSEKSVLTIPNLAIHMNREVNKGVALNEQTDLMPIFSLFSKKEQETDSFLEFLAEELQVGKEHILDYELYVYCRETPEKIGRKEEMISSPRLDNLSSVAALMDAIAAAKRMDGINLIALFDHEEIGSRSKQGAGAILLHDMLRRMLANLGANEEMIEKSIYQAMLLSVDVAHGMHPNKVSTMDITNQPVLGGGICIKEACSQSYATDAKAIAIFCQICDTRQIPYQRFVNRSDSRGGGTLGAILATMLPIKTVDIGVPILAMHSARELMGLSDLNVLADAINAFFSI